MSGARTLRVLVTGAEERQGLSVIRALGRGGCSVVAGGTSRTSIGFASRYATQRRTYTSPLVDREQCADELMDLITRHRPDLVMPGAEATLVVLNGLRGELEQWTTLAAPPAETLEYALDKSKTLRLAERLEVPVPASIEGATVAQILLQASDMRFPLAVKARGPRLHPSTRHRIGFTVRYARSLPELKALLEPLRDEAGALLVQEFVPGVGRCVAAVCNHGEPVHLFAYTRVRELPHTGGVSVVRRSEALDERLAAHATALLGAIQWHGIAVVEFRYDRRTDRCTLMEVHGRFPSSTALSLDAGLNLPLAVAQLFTGRPVAPATRPYRIGVTERWLRGDLEALRAAWSPDANAPLGAPPARRSELLWQFVRDFRPTVRMDEFKWWDWKPGAVETLRLVKLLAGWAGALLVRLARYARSAGTRAADTNAPTPSPQRVAASASTATHPSIRA